MKSFLRILPGTACGISVICLALAVVGCGGSNTADPPADSSGLQSDAVQPESTPDTSTSTSNPTASADTAGTAEPTSFEAVTSHLDRGGNLYLYVSSERWLEGLSGKVSNLRELILAQPGMNDEQTDQINGVFDLIGGLLKRSGLEEVSGVGMSGVAVEEQFYRSKMVLHHYADQDSGLLWSLSGREAHSFAAADYFPQDSVLAGSVDFDLPLLWETLRSEIRSARLTEADEWLDQQLTRFQQTAGAPFEELLDTLSGEFALALTLSLTNNVPIPVPAPEPVTMPEPGLILLAKVQDDAIFQRIDALLENNPDVTRVDEAGFKLRSVPVPAPLPFPFQPTFVQSGEYLILATKESLAREALRIKQGELDGLKSTEEFTKLSTGLPKQGNQFSFVSQRLGATIRKLQSDMIGNAPGRPTWAKFISQLGGKGIPYQSYTVTRTIEEGILSTSHLNREPAQVLAGQAISLPAALVAGAAMPYFLWSRQVNVSQTARPAPENDSLARKPAPDIDFIHLASGETKSLSDFRGKVVVLDFWASWCGPCQEPMAKMQTYRESHPDWGDRVELIALSIDDTQEAAVEHLKKKGWNKSYNAWAGEGGFNAAPPVAYNVRGIPSVFIIDQEGTIVHTGHPMVLDIPRLVSQLMEE